MWIAKLEEKVEKMVAVFETMAFEHVAGNSVNYNENTCDGQSTCYQTVLKFQV